jgi:hypothetical protein
MVTPTPFEPLKKYDFDPLYHKAENLGPTRNIYL